MSKSQKRSHHWDDDREGVSRRGDNGWKMSEDDDWVEESDDNFDDDGDWNEDDSEDDSEDDWEDVGEEEEFEAFDGSDSIRLVS